MGYKLRIKRCARSRFPESDMGVSLGSGVRKVGGREGREWVSCQQQTGEWKEHCVMKAVIGINTRCYEGKLESGTCALAGGKSGRLPGGGDL